MFGVVFTEYGNEEEVSWRDCRFVEAGQHDSPASSDGEASSSEEDEEKVSQRHTFLSRPLE